jgi:hypothetical protein
LETYEKHGINGHIIWKKWLFELFGKI